MKKAAIPILLTLLCLSTFLLYLFVFNRTSQHIVINEVSFANNGKQDWIELYNPGLNSLSLRGYRISDKNNEPGFTIDDNVIIGSHDVVLLHGKKSDHHIANTLRLTFNIGNGETLYLHRPDGTLIDHITVATPGNHELPFSLGRLPNGAQSVFIFHQPTPGRLNTGT